MRSPPPFRSLGRSCTSFFLTLFLGAQVALGSIELDIGDEDSIKEAAKSVAATMMEYYTGDEPGDVPGNLPDPYYWWEAGAMFGSLVDYYHYTGDDQYVDVTKQAINHQVGPDKNFMPPNQSRSLGNDDQAFWGMTALSAAENKFPNPPDDKPQYLALAQAVFNDQAGRWDPETCAGGLRWQIFRGNDGFDYKNSISNGAFFNIGSRLAMYTGNDTYAEWAEKTWDWMSMIGLISSSYQIFDGVESEDNCTSKDHVQWSYNNGIMMLGAANMYQYTDKSEKWKKRLDGIIEASSVFFEEDVMLEVACEKNERCNIDQQSFKAYLSRWMTATTKVADHVEEGFRKKFEVSAAAAALQCNGPENKCGLRWTMGAEYDGLTGVGQQMAALEIMQGLLVEKGDAPVNNETGTSKGDPSAGGGNSGDPPKLPSTITTADRVGAGFVTTLVLLGIAGGVWWMVS